MLIPKNGIAQIVLVSSVVMFCICDKYNDSIQIEISPI